MKCYPYQKITFAKYDFQTMMFLFLFMIINQNPLIRWRFLCRQICQMCCIKFVTKNLRTWSNCIICLPIFSVVTITEEHEVRNCCISNTGKLRKCAQHECNNSYRIYFTNLQSVHNKPTKFRDPKSCSLNSNIIQNHHIARTQENEEEFKSIISKLHTASISYIYMWFQTNDLKTPESF